MNEEAIVRDVNCVGPYSGSFAQSFCLQFPDNELFFKEQFDQGCVEPGKVIALDRGVGASPRWIFNLPTRIHWNGDIYSADLAAGIQSVFDFAIQNSIGFLKIRKFENANIAWEEIKIQFLISFSRIPDIQLEFIESIHPLKEVSVFTDGGVSHGIGGYGVVIRFGEFYKEFSAGYANTTVSRMELMASIIGLESLTEACRVSLFSDSRYVVDTITKGTLFRWLDSDWNKGKLKNFDLWQRFFDVYLQHQVKMIWVKGHSGVADNERCDELATQGRKREQLLTDLPEKVSIADRSKDRSSSKGANRSVKPQKPGDACPNCQKPLQKRNQITENPNSKYYYPWHLFCAEGCKRHYHVRSAKVLKDSTKS